MVTIHDNDTGPPAKPHEASAVMEFVTGELRSNPALTYDELRDRAHLNGFEVFPILYGRAKAKLGLVPTKTTAPEDKPAGRPVTPLLPGIVERELPAEPPSSPSGGRALGPNMRFVLAVLQMNPQATNSEVKDAGEQAGIRITPQIMLRARTRLGLPGQRKAAREAAGSSPRAERPAKPARPPARVRGDLQALDLESLVASIRETEEERNRLRSALERIVAIIEELV